MSFALESSGSVVLWLLAGYLSGTVPYGLLLTRAAGLGDIRSIGSGNIGRPMCCAPATRGWRRPPSCWTP
ncbi:glycerol-3-phosphate acyltransferase [Hankyongella ginsenosidimutans]|uniref:glycerol-3-phosphate acyltransferase n=1 Tax=Hankyongella ginsenosidimutans TaxID=1763828 RepID=UPI00319DBD07